MSERRFSKRVSVKELDEDARTATGAVLVPNEVDTERDFFRADAVKRMFNPDPKDGVMHAAFSEDDADLVRNEVVDEEIELNGQTYPPGTWVATRQYNDDELWSLVADGVLTGFSMGGRVTDERAYESAESLPDEVRFPAGVEEGPATQILDGSVDEVSDVDVPAVPRATYRELSKSRKAGVNGASREEFLATMQERGHDEEDAERLWSYLSEATDDDDEEKAASHYTFEVAGQTIDAEPPAKVKNAVEAAVEAKAEFDDISDCGTGVGDIRASQILGESYGLTAEDFVGRRTLNGSDRTPIPGYQSSHDEDLPSTDDLPTSWSEDTWTDGCGPVQAVLWGLTGDGAGREWADGIVDEIEQAKESLDTAKLLEQARTPEFTDTAPNDEWERPNIDEYVRAYYDGDVPDDVVMEFPNLPTEVQEFISYKSLLGSPDAETYVEGAHYPVVYPDGRLSEDALVSTRQLAYQVENESQEESLKRRARELLSEEFGHEFDDDEKTMTDDTNDTSIEKAGRTLSADNVHRAKKVHDCAERMLDAADESTHSPMARTYDEDKGDDFEMGDDMKTASAPASRRKMVPMASDAQLLYPDMSTAAQVARQMGIGEEGDDDEELVHSHTLDDDEWYMPGEDHEEFEEATEEMEMGMGGEDDTDDEDDKSMTTESDDPDSTDTEPPEFVDEIQRRLDDIEKRVQTLDDDDEEATKADDTPDEDVPEWAQKLADRVEDLGDRVDRVSKSTASTQQVGRDEPDEEDDLEKAKRDLFLPS